MIKMCFIGVAIMCSMIYTQISWFMFPVVITLFLKCLKIIIIIKVSLNIFNEKRMVLAHYLILLQLGNITANLSMWSSLSCADVLQQHVDGLIQTAEASSGLLFYYQCHHMWPNPYYSAQEPRHWRLPGLPAWRGHRCLPSEMNIGILLYSS